MAARTFQQNPGSPNELLEGEGFYLSYNPGHYNPGHYGPKNLLGALAVALGGDPSMEIVTAETALCVQHPDGREWLILNGDFRKDYEGLVDQGLAACRAFYNSQKDEHKSPWSTEREDRNRLHQPSHYPE